MTFQNIDLKTKQIGLSGELSWVVNEKIVLKLFGTCQKTLLYNEVPISPDSLIVLMISDAMLNSSFSSNSMPTERVEVSENTATPDFYGGAVFDIKLLNEKLLFSSNLYSYSNQVFKSKYSKKEIDGKLILNAKVSYKFLAEKLTVYFNARNLLGNKSEFAYMDEIGSLFLAGLKINL
jgi:iron complex outermembrane receptor protein